MAEPPPSGWQRLPQRLSPADGVVDVCRAEPGTVDAAIADLCSADELARADRFLSATDATRWLRGRGVLRALLGRLLDADPSDLAFEVGAHGKPSLAEGRLPRLEFNLAHSGELALVAVAAGVEVGVDVEVGRRQIDERAVAERVFGSVEARRLAALPAPRRRAEFLAAWVRHEAITKCHGTGIAEPADPERPPPWSTGLDLGPDAAAALAVARPPRELRLWHWGG